MSLIVAEQETQVSFMRDSDTCIVYTTDTTVMTKLDKLAESGACPHWKLKKIHRLSDGEIVGKTYETKKKLISFRKDIVSREMTPEQRDAAAKRIRAYQERRRETHAETPAE